MDAQAIAFAQGEYTCRSEHGMAKVTVPRYIRLGDISHALANLLEGRANATKKKNAPDLPTKASKAHN